jgi:hypothetical protein
MLSSGQRQLILFWEPMLVIQVFWFWMKLRIDSYSKKWYNARLKPLLKANLYCHRPPFSDYC